jgi:hypothetical protein
MARLVYREAIGDDRRVLGLGTVVETGRLRVALADHLRPSRAPRDMWALAVGTHDALFRSVVRREVVCPHYPEDEFAAAVRQATDEVIRAAARVKVAATLDSSNRGATIHPIVEGIVLVLEAIASDRDALLTVSVRDPGSPRDLFYSVPCRVGRRGVSERLSRLCDEEAADGLAKCREGLLRVLQGTASASRSCRWMSTGCSDDLPPRSRWRRGPTAGKEGDVLTSVRGDCVEVRPVALGVGGGRLPAAPRQLHGSFTGGYTTRADLCDPAGQEPAGRGFPSTGHVAPPGRRRHTRSILANRR